MSLILEAKEGPTLTFLHASVARMALEANLFWPEEWHYYDCLSLIKIDLFDWENGQSPWRHGHLIGIKLASKSACERLSQCLPLQLRDLESVEAGSHISKQPGCPLISYLGHSLVWAQLSSCPTTISQSHLSSMSPRLVVPLTVCPQHRAQPIGPAPFLLGQSYTRGPQAPFLAPGLLESQSLSTLTGFNNWTLGRWSSQETPRVF